jgi:hypothetical protein
MGCCSSLLLRSRLGHRSQHHRRCRCRPLVHVWLLHGCAAAALALVPGPAAAAAHVLLAACPQVLHPLPAAAPPQGLLGAQPAAARCQVAAVVAQMLALGAVAGDPLGAWGARGAALGAGLRPELARVVQQACCCAARAGLLCVEGRVVLRCWGRVQMRGAVVWWLGLAGGEGTAAECTALGHTAGCTAAVHTAAHTAAHTAVAAAAAAACTELAAAAERLQPAVPAAAARSAVAACTAAVVVVCSAAAAELMRLAVGQSSAAGTSAAVAEPAAAEPARPEQRSQAAGPACPGTHSAASDLYTGYRGHTVVGLDFLRSCEPSSRRMVADSCCWHSRKLTRTQAGDDLTRKRHSKGFRSFPAPSINWPDCTSRLQHRHPATRVATK